MKRHITWKRVWTVEIEGTDDDWAETTRQKYLDNHWGAGELDSLDHLVQTMIGNDDVVSDRSGITLIELVEE
jgi:hypothetical protein